MITDLIQISRLGEKKRGENEKFRKWIKSHNFVERQFRRAAQQVHAGIDCRECAECCRVTEAEIYEKDVVSLSKNLGLSRQRFMEKYTQTGTDGELILKRTEKDGCVFLDGNDCTIYDFRPKTCEGFPHLLKGMGSIQHKMWAYVDRATYCPIVYNWMEQVKDLTNFKK